MSQQGLVPIRVESSSGRSVSPLFLGFFIALEVLAAIVIYDALAFHRLPILTDAGILAFEAEAAVAAGIFTEVWLHYAELLDKKKPGPHPPTLVLSVHASEGDPEPTSTGSILALTNFGPGVAKDLTTEWFGYPETLAAKAFWKARGQRATIDLVQRRAALNVGEVKRWILNIPHTAQMETEYIIEVRAWDLFDYPTVPARYQVGRFVNPGVPGTPSPWVWQIRLDAQGRPVAPPSIEEMRHRSKSAGPPCFWDVG